MSASSRPDRVFDRLAGWLDLLGLEGRLFSSEDDASAFNDERPLHARDADGGAEYSTGNGSSTGLHWAYGVDGPGQGHTTSLEEPAS